MSAYDWLIYFVDFPVDWRVIIGARVLTILGLAIAAHALTRAHPGGLPGNAHTRGVAYTIVAACLLGAALLTGQSKLPSSAYQLGVNLGLWLWVSADVFLIGKRRWLNRQRRSRQEHV